jgi:hypothetical protein
LNCTLYYCDPNENKCVYDQLAYTGRPCGNERAPYNDSCHVDVCIGGLCVLNAPIDSSDPLSGGGMPPLTNPDMPWMKGSCVFNDSINDFSYNESEIHPFCGHWGCEAALGEDNMTCCEDCPCGSGYMCIAGSCRPISNATVASFSTNWQSWSPLIVLALLFGYLIAALIYMVAHIIGSPELEAWSKNEIYETSASAMIVASAVFFVGLLATLSTTLIGIGYEQAADDYVHLLSAELLRIYALMVKGIFAMGLLGYVGGQLSLPVVVTGIVNVGINGQIYPFGGMGLLSNTLLMFTNIISFAIMATIGQKVILDFILDVGFRVALPLAIFLRCFTFTRKIGATLMAIAIGAYIVYPITLVMNAQIYASVEKIPQSEYHSSAFPLDTFDMGPWMELFLGPNFGKWCKHWYDWLWMCWLFAILEWVVKFVIAIFEAMAFIMVVIAQVMRLGVAEVTASAFDYYVNMIPWAMQPITAAFLFPVLDLIVVITAIRSISEAIGGESRITGLAQFI